MPGAGIGIKANSAEVIVGVIPCAGASRRMGRPKGLLDAGGRTFLERIVRTQLRAGCDLVLAVLAAAKTRDESAGGLGDRSGGAYPRDGAALASRLAEEAGRGGAGVVWNHDPAAGPISSLRAALAALGLTDDSHVDPRPVAGILWHPVDHPLVSVQAVESILEVGARWARRVGPDGVFDPRRAGSGPQSSGRLGQTLLVVPRFMGRTGHPVLLGSSLFSELLDPGLRGGVRAVTRRHGADRLYCDVECTGIVADIDTPAEYKAAFGVDP